jgi:transposase
MEVQAAHQRGLTISAIARQTSLDRKTVRKYIQAPEFPEQASRASARRGSILDPFKPVLRQRWNEGCRTSRRLWRELRESGYAGGFTLVNDYLRHLRQSQGFPPRTRIVSSTNGHEDALRPVTPRRLANLMMAHPDKLTQDQLDLLQQAARLHHHIQATIQFRRTFAALVRGRQVDAVDPWLDQVAQSDVASLRGYARGLHRDYRAVKAVLLFPYSNGQTEGQVLRLKFLKRQGYGRTDFDLLRLRVLFRGPFG